MWQSSRHYANAASREDVEDVEFQLHDDSVHKLPPPGKGMQVHEPYMAYAHWMLLHRMLTGAGVERVQANMDIDSMSRTGFICAFADEIARGDAHGFYVRYTKFQTVDERKRILREANRARARYRATLAEERRRDAATGLSVVAPKGIEALRVQIAALPAPVESPDHLPSVEEAQEREAAARKALANASERWHAKRSASEQVQKQAARTAAMLEAAEGRQIRAETQLAEFEDPEAEKSRLKTAVSELTAAHGDAMQASEALSANAPDLEAAGAALSRARSVVKRADQDRHRIRVELSRLDAAIDIRAGEAVEEELADAVIRLDEAERRLDELEFEIAVLTKLEEALEEARASARDRYVEPVLSELAPLVRLVWPEAELRFDAENVLPAALERAGTPEQFAVLSGGDAGTDRSSGSAGVCADAGSQWRPGAGHLRRRNRLYR